MSKHGTASLGQWVEFQAAVLRQLPRPEECDANILDGWLSNQSSLQRALRGALLTPDEKPTPMPAVTYPTIAPFPITVDYGLSFERMVAAGKYCWKNDEITAKHFPVKGEGMVDIELQLVHFNRVMDSSEEVIRELDRMGLRPASIEELLAFGAKYPEEQRKYPIVELKSLWQNRIGGSDVCLLWGDVHERHLSLDYFGSRWYEDYRIAAVRK